MVKVGIAEFARNQRFLNLDNFTNLSGPARQNHNLVSQAHSLGQIVCDVDGRKRLARPQLDQIIHQQFAGLAVERRQRLVHQHDRGVHGQGTRDSHALFHTAGQLLGQGLGKVG